MNYVDDLVTLLPELILVVLVLTIITVDLFLSRENKWLLTPLTVAGLILAGAGCVVVWGINETVYEGMYVVDDLSVFFKAATILVGIISALFAPSYLVARRIPLGEFHMILVTALLGMCVLASSSDLITLFLGLELMTMPSYLLTGLHKTDRYSNEGGLKYFLLGSFASAIMLFGISWVYGITGTTNIAEMAVGLEGRMSGALLVAIGFLLVGGTFKIAAVPFHYWTPGCVPGRTDADHRIPVGRAEDRRVRAPDPRLRGGARTAPRRLARDLSGPDRPDHDVRQRGCPGPGQREADAGVLEHRPHRLHHGRRGGVCECAE